MIRQIAFFKFKTISLIGLFLLTTFYSHAATNLNRPGPRSADPKLIFNVDDDSVLSKKLGAQAVLGRKSITAAFLENEVTLEEGKTAKLGHVLGQAFEEQDRFARSAGSVASQGGILKGPVDIQDEVIEFDDSFAVVKSTRVVVRDPKALAAASPEFGSYLSGGGSGFNKAQMKPEGLNGLRNFMANELPVLPADHPLRQAAAAGGEDAVLEAIAQGKGDFEIVDTVVVPKKAFALIDGKLQMPTLKNGIFSYNRLQPFKAAKLNFRVMSVDFRALEIAPPAPETPPQVATEYESAASESSGRFSYRTQFLAGFTRGDSWEWERRWNFPSGFFRITLMGAYGIGMRIPIEARGEIAPTNIFIKDIRDRKSEVRHTAHVYALGGDARFYRDAGLSEDLIFEGNEVVLQVRFGWGCRFRALWTNVYHNRNSWDLDFDHSVNFTPPFGNNDGGFDIGIPPSMTNTALDLGVISGSAEAGIHVGGKGSVRMDYKTFMGNQTLQTQTIRSTDDGEITLPFELPALEIERGRTQKRFGFSLSKPEYHAELTLTPEVRVRIRAGYGSISRNFNTGWIRLNSMKIDLGGITFGRHAGTRREFKYADGIKKFQKIDAATQAPITPFLSDCSGKYVRAGVGSDCALAATSARADAWEKFQFFGSSTGNGVTIRSAQNGKYLAPGRDGVLRASSDTVGTINSFMMENYPDGTFSLYSVRLEEYVRAGVGANQESYLAAVSPHARAWEKFRFTPKPAPAPAPAAAPAQPASPPQTAPRVVSVTQPRVAYRPVLVTNSTQNLRVTTPIKPITFNYNPSKGQKTVTSGTTNTKTAATTGKTTAIKRT